MARFYWLALRAYVRGLFYRWPDQGPRSPGPYSHVSCGLKTLGECRAMYAEKWEPWCFQRTRGLGWSRVFRVPLTPEEIEYNRHVDAEWARLADEEAARRAADHDRGDD